MSDLSGFDANNVEPNEGFEPIPAGEYEAVISASETKPNAKANGEYLKLEFTIVSGQYENRKLWVNLNLKNPSDQAVQIARGELSAICRAVGVMTPRDSADLHDLPMKIKVGLTKRKDNGELTNKISKYIEKGSANGAAKPAQKPATAAGGAAPWARK